MTDSEENRTPLFLEDQFISRSTDKMIFTDIAGYDILDSNAYKILNLSDDGPQTVVAPIANGEIDADGNRNVAITPGTEVVVPLPEGFVIPTHPTLLASVKAIVPNTIRLLFEAEFRPLSVYTDGECKVIAKSPLDAVAVLNDFWGGNEIDTSEEGWEKDWKVLPMDEVITINYEDEQTGERVAKIAHTAQEWIYIHGRSVLTMPYF